MINKNTSQFVSLPVCIPGNPENTYTRPYGDELLNSRIPAKITDQLREIKWQTKIDPFLPARFILTANNRFIVFGSGRWHLLDAEGKSLATDFLGNSDVIFDPSRDLFYFADRFGQITAVKLVSHDKLFSMQISGLEDVERMFLYRNNGNFLIADKVENKNPHDASQNRFIYLEAYTIDEPVIVENGNLASFKELSHNYYYTDNFAAAANKDVFAYAIDNKLMISGSDLKLHSEYEGEFRPVTLSLDESGRIYLTVVNSENKLALWVLTPNGDMIVDTTIPVEHQTNSIPPVIGFNHEIFLVFNDRVFSYDERGNLKWQTLTDGITGGAVVTPDNKLLLSEGSLITQLDEKGERHLIFRFPGEKLTTPPVVTSHNEIVVATEGNIYLLSVKR